MEKIKVSLNPELYTMIRNYIDNTVGLMVTNLDFQVLGILFVLEDLRELFMESDDYEYIKGEFD